jgi:hypothetical protein
MAPGGNSMESAELLRRIRDEIQRKIEIPTSEWKTSREWMQEWDLKQSQTNRTLSQGVELGIMEAKTFRIPCPVRGSYPVPHYRHKTP